MNSRSNENSYVVRCDFCPCAPHGRGSPIIVITWAREGILLQSTSYKTTSHPALNLSFFDTSMQQLMIRRRLKTVMYEEPVQTSTSTKRDYNKRCSQARIGPTTSWFHIASQLHGHIFEKESFLTYSTQTERISRAERRTRSWASNLTLDLLLLGLLSSFPYKLPL
jgi:hypothetical protein